jgi:antirestriction protein ArdC
MAVREDQNMARNLYAEVTYRILNQLEAGTPPWVKE